MLVVGLRLGWLVFGLEPLVLQLLSLVKIPTFLENTANPSETAKTPQKIYGFCLASQYFKHSYWSTSILALNHGLIKKETTNCLFSKHPKSLFTCNNLGMHSHYMVNQVTINNNMVNLVTINNSTVNQATINNNTVNLLTINHNMVSQQIIKKTTLIRTC